MATQVKHRRGTQSEIDSFTPAIGEWVHNTDDNSIHVGDGVKQGGYKIPSTSNSRVLNVTFWGIKPGPSNAITNCDKYAALASYINTLQESVVIYWPPSVLAYEFSPKDNTNFNQNDYDWRNQTELVDVKRVFHKGYGATVKVNADPTWTRGNPNTGAGAVALGCDESPIQFRSSVQGGCRFVGVIGLSVVTTATVTDSTPTFSDGTALGISYRGCEDTVTRDAYTELWGTDGIYFGTAYSSAFGGKNHYVENPKCSANYRQGISVVGNDNGLIIGGEIKDTFGSTFGYAIDFEPNSADGRQENWTVKGLKTENNERGACNHIRTQNVVWDSCFFDEQRDLASNSGCTKFDGSQDTATLTNNIKFTGCTIIGLKATIYAIGDYLDDISFDNCTFKCTGDVNTSSQFRINAGDNANFGTFKITNSRIYGNGGLNARGVTGGLDTKLVFEGNEWYPSDEGATTPVWLFDTNSPFVDAQVKGNTIDFTKGTWTPAATYQPYVVEGFLEGNTFESTSSYVVEWRDWGAGRNVVIGVNKWGAYSYYDGVSSGLDIKSKEAAVQRIEVTGGDFGTPRRVVHGGRKRIIEYLASPGSFVNQQAPQDGDLLWNLGNNSASIPQVSYVYDSGFGGWRITSFATLKGTTPNRPNTSATPTEDTGVQYLDTTLNANGQLITWNGANWVDTSGTVV